MRLQRTMKVAEIYEHKKKGAQTLRCCAPRLVPSPRYFAKLKPGLDRGAGGRSRSRVGATDHARCVAEEAAHTALVHDCRVAIDAVTDRRRTGNLCISEEVAALAAGSSGGLCKRVIDQATRSNCRGARVRAALAKRQPIGRLVTPAEVADVVALCVGNGAINGQGINVDGGTVQS